MNVALDAGSREMRSLHFGNEGRLVARRCPSLYSVLEDDPPLRSLLGRVGVCYAVCDRQILVYGNDVEASAALFRVPPLELFPEGQLPEDDPPVRQLTAMLVESLIGHGESDRDICVLTLPGTPTTDGDPRQPTAAFIARLARLQGYRPLVLSAPHAAVLAHLAGDAFTGIGLSCGAGTCEASLVHRGAELSHCAVPYAGNWIDRRMARAQGDFVWDAAGHRHLNTTAVRRRKEAFAGSLTGVSNRDDQRLVDLHRGMLEFLFREASARFASVVETWRLARRLGLVVTGGTARLPHFEELITDVLSAVNLPVEIQQVHMATGSDLTVARGGLIRAELETGEDAGPLAKAA